MFRMEVEELEERIRCGLLNFVARFGIREEVKENSTARSMSEILCVRLPLSIIHE